MHQLRLTSQGGRPPVGLSFKYTRLGSFVSPAPWPPAMHPLGRIARDVKEGETDVREALIVEDDDAVREVVEKALHGEGLRTVGAREGW